MFPSLSINFFKLSINIVDTLYLIAEIQGSLALKCNANGGFNIELKTTDHKLC